MFTKETKNAIIAVAGECIWDIDGDRREEIVAEVALDANRLTTFSYPEADKEVAELIRQYGWERVKAAAAEFVPTYI